MRIISGQLGGRRLATAEGDGLRPAMARTREALFSMLASRNIEVENCQVLDLFAGCGSLGFECLSRGAPLAWFVDNGAGALASLRKNMEQFELAGRTRIINNNVLRFLSKAVNQPFDLVFIDPPYRRDLVPATLDLLQKRDWLKPGAVIVAETEQEFEPRLVSGFPPTINRLFGQTRLFAWTLPK